MAPHAVFRSRARQRGDTFVEFALAFLFFILLIFGLVELSRAMWTYTTLAHASRAGARYAMAHGSANPATADQVAAVVDANAIGVDTSQLTVKTTWNPSNTRGAIVQVQVSYPFYLVTGSMIWTKDPITLGAKSQMIVGN